MLLKWKNYKPTRLTEDESWMRSTKESVFIYDVRNLTETWPSHTYSEQNIKKKIFDLWLSNFSSCAHRYYCMNNLHLYPILGGGCRLLTCSSASCFCARYRKSVKVEPEFPQVDGSSLSQWVWTQQPHLTLLTSPVQHCHFCSSSTAWALFTGTNMEEQARTKSLSAHPEGTQNRVGAYS